MLHQRISWLAAVLLFVSGSCLADTIAVKTNLDEFNPNQDSMNGPKNMGCSLREAIQVIDTGTNSTYMQCDPPGSAPYTIDLTNAGGTIAINSLVNDPSQPTGLPKIRNQGMPDIFNGGAVIIMGGDITCDPGNDENIFIEASGADLTLNGVTIHDCTAFGAGIAVANTAGMGNLTIKGSNFINIKGTSTGPGGAVSHSGGTLTVEATPFTNCSEDNGSGGGSGGAIGITSVSFPNFVTIDSSPFSKNSAGDSGGAIYVNGVDSLTISNEIFTLNTAGGDSSNNAEAGGGAIWAGATGKAGVGGDPLTSATNFFLIFNTQFISNSASNGTGGALVLSGGDLSYGTFDFTKPKIPGGIVASNFTGNSANGPAPSGIDPRSGSGGAIYAAGNLSILQSSFVSAIISANSSAHGSGGAIAFYDATNSLNPMVLANVTISGNTADQNGGAIANLLSTNGQQQCPARIMLIRHDTIDNNAANGTGGTFGGAFFNANGDPSLVNASNTIFSNTITGMGGNCAGQPFHDAGTNLQYPAQATTCGATIPTMGDPKLNGPSILTGPNLFVFTMSLNPGSAASNAGTNSICNGVPVFTFDGTGTPGTRPSPAGSNCDIGAFESGIAPDLTITKTHADPFAQGDVGKDYTITVNNNGTTSTSGAVTVTDTLPAGLTATAFAGTGWTGCTATPVVGPNTLTCTRNDALPNGSSYPPIILTVSVAANAPVQVTNIAMVAGGGEASLGNDTVSDVTNITAVAPDLTITKSHTDPFAQGQTGDTYTITVANAGNGPSSGAVTVTDLLPAGLTATGFTGTGWTGCTAPPVVGPNPLTCTRSDVLPNGTPYPPITLTVSVAANAPAQVTNTAMVSGGGETNLGNDTATDLTNVTPVVLVPDLTITKTHMDPFAQGATGDTYTITVANAGTGPTSGAVTVTDTLPAGLTATGFAGTGWTSCTATPVVGPNTLTCTRSTVLANGSSYPPIVLTVSVAANAAAQVTNSASVAGGGESNTGNDSVNDLTNITPVVVAVPDMTITKTHMDPFAQGATGDTYTITVANGGTGPSSGAVTVTDILPAGLTATGFAGTGWTGCTATPVVGPNPLTCTRSDALANGSAYPPITLIVSVAANAAAQVTNSAMVSGGGESNMGNDVVNDLTNITAVVAPVPDLNITKTHSDPFTQGDSGDTYTITVGNSGNGSTTSAVTVTDTLPAGLTATGFAGTGWTGCTATPVVGPNSLTCTRSNVLTAGSAYPPITLTVSVAANAAAQVTNTAMVSGGGESNMGNDIVNDLTNISGVPDLTVSDTHVGNFSLGQIGDLYTITVHNIGTGPTAGMVTLTNNLPTGLTATAIGGTGWDCSGTPTPVVGPGVLTCTSMDVVPVGSDFPIIALTVNVAANAPHLLTDSVIVSGGGETNTTNDTANDATTTPVRLQSFEVD